MNRKFLTALIAVMITGAVTACGSKDTSELKYLSDIKAKDYVKLGEYKGVEVELDDPEVTDEYLDGYIDYVLLNSPVSTPVTERSVEVGDTANIDYEGKLDGVAFEGGTAKGFDLTIGSGRFIDGFEDGVVGMEIGETRDINLTFPDPYTNPDLAGKDVVFTVTVNSISVQETPELTDEYVAGLGLEDVSTVEDYRNYMYDVLMEQAQSTYEDDKINAVVEAVEGNTVFDDAPEGMVNRMKDTMLSNFTTYAQMYGMEVGDYVAAVYGGTAEEYEEVLLSQSTQMVQRYVMLAAIADKEGISITDKELEETLAEEAESYGYESVESYEEAIDVEAYREYLLVEEVLDFLTDNAVVKGQAAK